jgi:hypothetical protein
MTSVEKKTRWTKFLSGKFKPLSEICLWKGKLQEEYRSAEIVCLSLVNDSRYRQSSKSIKIPMQIETNERNSCLHL